MFPILCPNVRGKDFQSSWKRPKIPFTLIFLVIRLKTGIQNLSIGNHFIKKEMIILNNMLLLIRKMLSMINWGRIFMCGGKSWFLKEIYISLQGFATYKILSLLGIACRPLLFAFWQSPGVRYLLNIFWNPCTVVYTKENK